MDLLPVVMREGKKEREREGGRERERERERGRERNNRSMCLHNSHPTHHKCVY